MLLATEARQFLRTTRRGVLSTFSAKFPSYPFGSVAPFITNHHAEPVILISTLAEHTKNILENPKVSLLILAGDDDLQANARLTLIGEAEPCDRNDANLRARYLRYMPQAESYFDMHDFSFYRIKVAQARYIAGFGKMGWLDAYSLLGEDLLSTNTLLAQQEAAIIEHMNTDHVHSLIAYCKHFQNTETTQAQMIGIDSDGFDVVILDQAQKTQYLRFNFEQAIHDAQSARAALVAMSKAAKI